MYNLNVNFGGFYNSEHENFVEYAVNDYNADDQGKTTEEINNKIYDMDYNDFWGKLYKLYAIDYIDILNEEVGLNLKFENIDSPKFYNYSTDIFICSNFKKYNLFTLKRYIISNDLQKELKEELRRVTTSASGYIAFYSIDEIIEDVELYGMTLLDVIINSLGYDFFLNEFDMINTSETIGNKSAELIS